MRYVIIVPDGMADYPIRELSWRTPLMASKAPCTKSLGTLEGMGLFLSLPRGSPAGSDAANMSIMGYDPITELTGRGALEATALGIELEDADVAFRCNFVTIRGDTLADYSSGHISDSESRELLEFLNDEIGDESVVFHFGKSYRNILILKGEEFSEDVETTPPHDIVGSRYSSFEPQALSQGAERTARRIRKLMARSKELLSHHPIIVRRERLGLNPANMIWPWSPGRRLRIKPFRKVWGISAAAISAVTTVRGLAKASGMDAPEVPGATGMLDTNFEAKVDFAIDALATHDLVYLHLEAADEMGHAGDVRGKIRAIEEIDSRVVSPMLSFLERSGHEFRVAVIPDHFTPCTIRTHVRDPTPFVIVDGDRQGTSVEFNEETAKTGLIGVIRGDSFLRLLLGDSPL